MRFTKLHGAGNDFLVIDARSLERDWEEVARRICDRHTGVGADGILLVLPPEQADVRMRLFNSDGSEAEISGNGLRCFVKYVVERGIASLHDGALAIETLAGVRTVDATLVGGRVEAVRAGMGRPRFAPDEVPVAIEAQPPLLNVPLDVDGATVTVSCISMGNPHAVHFTSEPVDAYPLETIGPKVEHHPLFPQRVNFEVARVLARDRIESRTWERGAGITLACGSGACAVMVAARLLNLADSPAEVREPGGPLTLEWDGGGEVYLSGPAVEVFEGEWPE